MAGTMTPDELLKLHASRQAPVVSKEQPEELLVEQPEAKSQEEELAATDVDDDIDLDDIDLSEYDVAYSAPEQPDREIPSEHIPEDYSEYDAYMEIEAAAKAVKNRQVRPSKQNRSRVKQKTAKPEQVRDLSSTVMDVIRREFPQQLSKADAISAYVYVHSAGTELGSSIELSEAAKNAVREYAGDNTMSILDERLSHLERMMAKVSELAQFSELALAYIVCDRTFGIKTQQLSPKDAEFRETNVLDILDRLRVQAAEQHAVDTVRNGRPKRQHRAELFQNTDPDDDEYI